MSKRQEQLNHIAQMAERLSGASDRMNAAITQVNDALREAKIGFEFWHEADMPIGWCRCNRQWQLATRLPGDDNAIPLLSASRLTRVNATKQMDAFLDRFSHAIDEQIADTDNAYLLVQRFL